MTNRAPNPLPGHLPAASRLGKYSGIPEPGFSGAFWDGGAQAFINKGVNGHWTETLTAADNAGHEGRAVRELGPEYARWLAHGGAAPELQKTGT